jgi:Pentapeptide repeats (8 copies)
MRRLNLSGIRFDKTFLIYTNFSNSNLDDVVFDSAVRNVDFSGASLSNVTFIKTDWFNALYLSVEAEKGWPIPYTEWLPCPKEFKLVDQRSFIQTLDTKYWVKFNELETEDANNLVDGWKVYAEDNGLCDQLLRKP